MHPWEPIETFALRELVMVIIIALVLVIIFFLL
jgi:hypothetical protein